MKQESIKTKNSVLLARFFHRIVSLPSYTPITDFASLSPLRHPVRFPVVFLGTFRSRNELILPPASSKIRHETFSERRCLSPGDICLFPFPVPRPGPKGAVCLRFRRPSECLHEVGGINSNPVGLILGGKKRTFLTFAPLKVQRMKTGGVGEKKSRSEPHRSR